MKKLLSSKHRSLIFFLISCVLILFDFFYLKYYFIEIGNIPIIENFAINDFFKHSQPVFGLYVSFSLTICSIFLIFKDLKPYKKKGLIRVLVLMLPIGSILGIIVGLVIGTIIVLANSNVSEISGLTSGITFGIKLVLSIIFIVSLMLGYTYEKSST